MPDLRKLQLLRNDPEVADEFLRAATSGDVDAQYGTGLIYAEGRGVPQDEARAFYWLTRAMEQGDRDAEDLRRVVAATMTREQFDAVGALVEHYAGLAPAPETKPDTRGRMRRTGN